MDSPEGLTRPYDGDDDLYERLEVQSSARQRVPFLDSGDRQSHL